MRKTNEELDASMDSYAAMEAKWGSGERILVTEYMERHPELLDEFASREEKMFGLSWTEYLARSNRAEADFVRSIRGAQNGLFGEVMNIIYVMDGGRPMKKAAYSGKAREISSAGIHSFRPFETHPAESRDTRMVVMIHNHPDLLAKSRIGENQKYKRSDLVTRGLTMGDIECSNNYLRGAVAKRVPVVMMAVNELGLTYSYVAGTSGRYFR